jgi:DNA-binding NarL/FixJ family response regulator
MSKLAVKTGQSEGEGGMEVGATIRCVIGDDHDAVRGGVRMLLERQEAMEVVGEGADGPTLLGLIERRVPDVAIVDMRMPDLDGLAVCREVASRELPTAVIIYTAFSDPRCVEETLEAGARGFVLKSSPSQDLLRAVNVVHQGEVFVDPMLAGELIRLRKTDSRELLTTREREVLQLLARGMTTETAAESLFLAPTTVRSYAENAMHKLESRNRTEAVAKALRLDLID